MRTPDIQACWDWWVTGLTILLPHALLQRIRPAPDRLIVEPRDDSYHLRLHKDGASQPVAEWTLHRHELADPTVVRTELNEQVNADNTVAILALPRTHLLVKSLTLPLGAGENLREVLGFEMDRQTPFTADKVYFDWRAWKKDTENDKLHIELVVVLKEILDAILTDLRGLPLPPHTVTVAPFESDNRINLLPEGQDTRSLDTEGRRTRLLAAVTACLFLAALYLPVMRQESVLDEAEAEVAALRDQAREVQDLIRQRDELRARQQFLSERKQAQVPAIDVLDHLTGLLPMDTWVNRLSIQGEELQIYGESDTAADLIPLIENTSGLANPQFTAPVTQNDATGKARFQISAELTGDGIP